MAAASSSSSFAPSSNFDKWNAFYENAVRYQTARSSNNEGDIIAHSNCSVKLPPWESREAFTELKRYFESLDTAAADTDPVRKCIELGCGSSASSIYMAELSNTECVAVDISSVAMERTKLLFPDRPGQKKVRWLQRDILSPDFVDSVGGKESYDFVFDMQCFHVLRETNETHAASVIYNLLRPGGVAMVVTGAVSDDEAPLIPGPAMLTKEEVLAPFTAYIHTDSRITSGMEEEEGGIEAVMEVVNMYISRFNQTEHYSQLENPPKCWVTLFRKPNAEAARGRVNGATKL